MVIEGGSGAKNTNDIYIVKGLSEQEQKLEEKIDQQKIDTFQDEMKLSVSEIISKRFKDKIKIQEATSPSEVEKLIIRPPEAANSEFEN